MWRKVNQFMFTCMDMDRMVLVSKQTFVRLVFRCWIEALSTSLLTYEVSRLLASLASLRTEFVILFTLLPSHRVGGGEMGRQWYEEPNGAKYLCKKNTFNDFVDVARWLVNDRKLTTPELLSCEGRSAGGLLIGASINQAPDLFKTAILGVPFVDVVPTMIDHTIPLTTAEWPEWGNPNGE